MRTVVGGVLALSLLASPAVARESSPEGFWSGAIELPGQKLGIMLDIEQDSASWNASLYAPAQGIRGAALTGVQIRDRTISFRIPLTPGEPTFHGELAEDGTTIAGSFTQSGQTMAFSVTRTEKPAELRTDIYADFRRPGIPGEGLQGTWRALLTSGLHRMRLELEVWSGEDGELAGTLDSVDQQASGLQVDGFLVMDRSVWFQMALIGAEYDGTLAADGSEIAGTWRQKGQEFPLTFRRQGRD